MRVVADTNVFISALNFGGVSDEVLSLAISEHIDLYVSLPILQEIEAVLIRKFHWTANRALAATRNILRYTRLVAPETRLSVVLEDEPDNRILECAVAAQAEVIVSGDRHLRRLKRFGEIAILSPGEFLLRHQAPEHHG